MENIKFMGFLEALEKFPITSNFIHDFSNGPELDVILSGMASIKEDQIKNLYNILGLSPEKIEKDLDSFFNPVFTNPDKGIALTIRDISGDYFYIKKSFQLSHLHKFYRKKLSGLGEFGNYFFMHLYNDYRETLNARLIGLYFHFFDKDEKEIYHSSGSFYSRLFGENYFDTLKEIFALDELNEFQDQVKFCDYICSETELTLVPDRKSALIRNEKTVTKNFKRSSYFLRIRSLMLFLTLFSTEFDLRFFHLIKTAEFDDNDLSAWKDYFLIYRESWREQQKAYSTNAHS